MPVNSALFPLHLIAKHVHEIKIGEYAFVAPNVLWVDGNFRCWLYSDLEVLDMNLVKIADVDSLLVKRDENGYHIIRNPKGTYRWPVMQHAEVFAKPDDAVILSTEDLQRLEQSLSDDDFDELDELDEEEMMNEELYNLFNEERPFDFPIATVLDDETEWMEKLQKQDS